MSEQTQDAGGGPAALNETYTGGDAVGGDKHTGDQLRTRVGGNVAGAVLGSKGVRQTQTRNDSPDVTVNNYERSNADLVERLEEKLEAQINRLQDNVNGRITTFESNMNWKLELVDRDIDALKNNASRIWLPLLTVIASIIIAFAMIYFGAGLYSLANELRQQRIEIQKGGAYHVHPSGFVVLSQR